jgi:signal peptidase II
VTIRAIVLIAALIAAADRLTKLWIIDTLDYGSEIEIVSGFFSIVHFRNPGAAFGMASGLASPWREALLISVAVLAVVLLGNLVRMSSPSERLLRVSAASIIGGAIGNLYDRIAYGEVVDFLYVYWGDWHWPAFNVADSCITVGAILLIVATARGESQDVDEADQAATP